MVTDIDPLDPSDPQHFEILKIQYGGCRHFEKSENTGSSFSGQTVVDTSICIKVEYEVGYCECVYSVYAIFLLPVWA